MNAPVEPTGDMTSAIEAYGKYWHKEKTPNEIEELLGKAGNRLDATMRSEVADAKMRLEDAISHAVELIVLSGVIYEDL